MQGKFSYRVIAKRRDVAVPRLDTVHVVNKQPDRVPTPSAPPDVTVPSLPKVQSRSPQAR